MPHLTDATIRRLPTPAKGNKVHYDDEVPGFGCRVTAAGARAFILNYVVKGSGRERRITIGQFPDWSTTAARAKARELRRSVDDGADPLADIEAERAAPTVAELIDRFEQEHLPRLRASSQADYKRMINNHIRPHFGAHVKVQDVTFSDVDRLHRKITAAGHLHRANRVVTVLSKAFALAQRWAMCDSNPCRGVERNYESKRKRYLSTDELARLVKALAKHEDKQAADIVRLALLTGARRGEILSARWADIDLAAGIWTKPGSSTKQKTDHIAPLNAPALALLNEIREQQVSKRHALGEYVFPGHGSGGHRVNIKRDWRQLCRAADLRGLRVHDLRHSYASFLVGGGASLPLVGALLGHSNAVTTSRYAHLADDPLRAATERVGAVIAAAGKPAKEPVKLKRPGR
jgi:integrase